MVLDPPGHELQYVIEQLSKYHRIRWHKHIVIIILAPTKGYTKRTPVDAEYIEEQYQLLKHLWIPVLKANSSIRPQTVVLFLNKNDLFDNGREFEGLFARHVREMEQMARETGLHIEKIRGSIINKAGMTALMDILKKR